MLLTQQKICSKDLCGIKQIGSNKNNFKLQTLNLLTPFFRIFFSPFFIYPAGQDDADLVQK
jgi:hypothetical protein